MGIQMLTLTSCMVDMDMVVLDIMDMHHMDMATHTLMDTIGVGRGDPLNPNPNLPQIPKLPLTSFMVDTVVTMVTDLDTVVTMDTHMSMGNKAECRINIKLKLSRYHNTKNQH